MSAKKEDWTFIQGRTVESLEIKIHIVRKGGGGFELYAKSLEDIERFSAFLKEYTEAVTKKAREDMEKEGWRKVQ